jgi:type VI secretion system protein ImpH
MKSSSSAGGAAASLRCCKAVSPQPTSAITRLLAEPQRFGFFQAVRLLERWFEQQEGLAHGEALAQRLQFRNSMSLSFPASEIAELVLKAAAPGSSDAAPVQQVEIVPAFISLLGAGGTLPIYYTELFAQRELYKKDTAARAFLDIFLHRAVVLFYQSWCKHRLALRFESDRRNSFAPMVLSLAGLGSPALRNRLRAGEGGVSDTSLAYFAGVLRQRPVSAIVIRRVLAQYFKVPVRLDSFVGRWFTLPRDNQTTLGLANGALGGGAVMGERVWQRDLRLRLTIGPMVRAKYRRFLPGGPAELALRELLTLMTGVTLEYEVRLTLRAADVQQARFDTEHGPRLGWDGFLTTRPADRDRSDAGYDIHAMA